jgi:dTDP-4-dehydrorhamnose reductase
MKVGPHVLVLGGGGLLGQAFRRLASARQLSVTSLTRNQLDIRDLTSVRAALEAIRPSVIVNAAAYTAVDHAERETVAAFAANAMGAAIVADATRVAGIPLLHVSTDYVFSGELGRPYLETDSPGPLGIYGRSKLAGEEAVLSLHPEALVVRTAGLYGLNGSNFVRSIVDASFTRSQLQVVDDQFGCPTFADDLAEALLIVSQEWGAFRTTPGRVVHFCGNASVSRFEFAQCIRELARSVTGRKPEIVPVKTTRGDGQAIRPRDSSLNCELAARLFGIEIASWESALPRMLKIYFGDPFSYANPLRNQAS